VDAFKQAHYDLNRPGQMPLQAALAEFIELGHFASSLRRARHRLRPAPPVPAGGPAAVPGEQRPDLSAPEQGLHLCLRLPVQVDDTALAQRIAGLGLTVRALTCRTAWRVATPKAW